MNNRSDYSQDCMEAWLNCENLLVSIMKQDTPFSARTKEVLDECSLICMGTFHALKNKMINIQELALLCVGICEECAEVCERYNDALFSNCASACRRCSTSISSLVSAAV
jgi:hypothetical protein